MNIFVLDDYPSLAARYHCDKHVVKQIVESAQILSTAHYCAGSYSPRNMYKPTHINHPCAVWARKRAANYRWLLELYAALLREYTSRYQKLHKTQRLKHSLVKLPRNLRDCSQEQSYNTSSFVLCMPDEYKEFSDAVLSYRKYYRYGKRHMAQWNHGPIPYWWR